VFAVRSSNKEVIAVGAMACSSEDLKNKPDNQGIACYILHVFNDKLWEFGSKKIP